jgi:hypothetical protein
VPHAEFQHAGQQPGSEGNSVIRLPIGLSDPWHTILHPQAASLLHGTGMDDVENISAAQNLQIFDKLVTRARLRQIMHHLLMPVQHAPSY